MIRWLAIVSYADKQHILLNTAGSTTCFGSVSSSEAGCLAHAQQLVAAAGNTMTRKELTVASTYDLPRGCSVESGLDWAAHYNTKADGSPPGAGFTPVCVLLPAGTATAQCSLNYCNAHADLKANLYGGSTCATAMGGVRCVNHWLGGGQTGGGKTEASRTYNPVRDIVLWHQTPTKPPTNAPIEIPNNASNLTAVHPPGVMSLGGVSMLLFCFTSHLCVMICFN